MTKEVVITGMGMISPVGNTIDDSWNNLIKGNSGIDIIKSFDPSDLETKIAGEIKDFNPIDLIGKKESRRMDRFSQLAMVAAQEALNSARLNIDETNERWEELSRHPDWSFPTSDFPDRKQLLESRNRIIARHPATIFIGAHMANNAEDLRQVSHWLDSFPNLYVEFASRIGELGRQPYTARRFFLRYSDRILFGTDGPWPEKRISLYWRFLETFDEYFPYSEKEFPPQGFWNIYGLGLPDSVLRRVYHENAMQIIPGLREKFANAITQDS